MDDRAEGRQGGGGYKELCESRHRRWGMMWREKEGDGTGEERGGEGGVSPPRWGKLTENWLLAGSRRAYCSAHREGGRREDGDGGLRSGSSLFMLVSPPPWSRDASHPGSLIIRGCLFCLFLHHHYYYYYYLFKKKNGLSTVHPSPSVAMSDSEDMTEFASIVERIERGEVSLPADDLWRLWQQRSVRQCAPGGSSAGAGRPAGLSGGLRRTRTGMTSQTSGHTII